LVPPYVAFSSVILRDVPLRTPTAEPCRVVIALFASGTRPPAVIQKTVGFSSRPLSES
jgi:hypothetical protein